MVLNDSCTFGLRSNNRPTPRNRFIVAYRESERRGKTALRSTFIHIPGVGYSTERHLWEEGVQSWDEFRKRRDSLGLRSDILAAINSGLEISEDSDRKSVV